MSDARVLILDEDPRRLHDLFSLMRRAGYAVRARAAPEEALDGLDEVAVVIAPASMSAMSGLDFLRRVQLKRPQTARFLMGIAPSDVPATAFAQGTVTAAFSEGWDEETLRSAIDSGLAAYSKRARFDSGDAG